PLPVLHLCVFGRPAVGGPIRLGILRCAAGTAGKANDDFNIEHFGEEDRFAKNVDVLLREFGIGMQRVAMTTESGDANAAVFEFLLPRFRFGFGAIGDEVVERAMMIVGI